MKFKLQKNRIEKLEAKLERQANRIKEVEEQIALQKNMSDQLKSNVTTMNNTAIVTVFAFMESIYQRMNLMIM